MSESQTQDTGSRIPGWLVVVAWLVTMPLAYYGPGRWFAERVEGMDPAQIPLLPSVLCILTAISAIVLTVLWHANCAPGPARRPTRAAAGSSPAARRSPAVSSARARRVWRQPPAG